MFMSSFPKPVIKRRSFVADKPLLISATAVFNNLKENRKCDPVASLGDKLLSIENKKDDSFGITPRELLDTVNQLNIEASLSKMQLNAMEENGYNKSKIAFKKIMKKVSIKTNTEEIRIKRSGKMLGQVMNIT